jgi:ABC-type lipoprotein release transport system permease subunit
MERFSVALFLAQRYLAHSNRWMTILVISVMTLTFLNMVAVTGILRGFTEGTKIEYQTTYSGDILLSKLDTAEYIEGTPELEALSQSMPEIRALATRFIEVGTIEAGFQKRLGYRNIAPDIIAADIVGINPAAENAVTGLAQYVTEGSYLTPTDAGFILIGRDLLESYSPLSFAGFETIRDVVPGNRVRMRIGNVEKDMIVKGIVDLKARPTNRRVYMLDSELRSITSRSDYSSDEIAILLHDNTKPEQVKNQLLATGAGSRALVRTAAEAQGKLIADLEGTFNILSTIVGSIGVLVASITIFVVIFITAITRRRYIGILKGIGIDNFTIETSYILLSLFYTLIGIVLGTFVVYGILVPYFSAYPISFPFNYGTLVAEVPATIGKMIFMICAAIVASYVPIWLIVRQNTLDAILGRQS